VDFGGAVGGVRVGVGACWGGGDGAFFWGVERGLVGWGCDRGRVSLPLKVSDDSCSTISWKDMMAPIEEVMTTRLMFGCLSAARRILIVPLTAGVTNAASKSPCWSTMTVSKSPDTICLAESYRF